MVHRKQPYVHLHVTLLTTTSPSLNASYFSLPPSSSIPSTILTTLSTHRTDPSSPRPEFNSITYHGETAEGSGEWVVKIFSESRREEGWLEEVFGGRVGWVLRKEWEAYPLSVFFQPSHPVSPLFPSLRFGAATLNLEKTDAAISRNFLWAEKGCRRQRPSRPSSPSRPNRSSTSQPSSRGSRPWRPRPSRVGTPLRYWRVSGGAWNRGFVEKIRASWRVGVGTGRAESPAPRSLAF